jgi:hypothetical protein
MCCTGRVLDADQPIPVLVNALLDDDEDILAGVLARRQSGLNPWQREALLRRQGTKVEC